MPDHEILSARADTGTGHVGTYRRTLPVSLERMYENTLDWEHLPHVHAGSFGSIDCIDAGAWGWRATVTDPRGSESVIELTLDRPLRRWITRNLEGPNKGAEIWTHVFPVAPDQLEIVVDFFVPGVSESARDKVGQAYAGLYSRLYDEDVAMMVERQHQLDNRIDPGEREVELGSRESLTLPMQVTLGSQRYVIDSIDDELIGYPALCPHQLGPLADSAVEDGTVTCPWHGYRFDVRTGDCVSGQSCRLRPLQFSESDGAVRVSLKS